MFIIVYSSFRKTFERAESLINGEKAFMMASPYSHATMEDEYFQKYGKKEFPLRKIKEM